MLDENIVKEQTEQTVDISINNDLLLRSTIMKNATPSQLARGRIGRNEICPCGSQKKYKKCCYYKTR